MRQVKVALMCVQDTPCTQDTPPNSKNSGTTDAKCPQMKDKVAVIQRKQPGTQETNVPEHKKGRAWRRTTDGKRSIAEMSRIARTFFGMCRITGCNPASFGAIRGAFVPGVPQASTICLNSKNSANSQRSVRLASLCVKSHVSHHQLLGKRVSGAMHHQSWHNPLAILRQPPTKTHEHGEPQWPKQPSQQRRSQKVSRETKDIHQKRSNQRAQM
jgi:hypothetical protein